MEERVILTLQATLWLPRSSYPVLSTPLHRLGPSADRMGSLSAVSPSSVGRTLRATPAQAGLLSGSRLLACVVRFASRSAFRDTIRSCYNMPQRFDILYSQLFACIVLTEHPSNFHRQHNIKRYHFI